MTPETGTGTETVLERVDCPSAIAPEAGAEAEADSGLPSSVRMVVRSAPVCRVVSGLTLSAVDVRL
jgi:hypothetical protein